MMADVSLPAISITSPTPPRPLTTTEPGSSNATPTPRSSSSLLAPAYTSTSTSTSTPPTYRLLYRGALSLPDSHLLLDGLTFSARLESPSKHSHLLDNPLALALESMRGRPSLSFLGTIKLADIWMDESGSVEMDIHPHATLSKVYFETMFCLAPFPQASTSTKARGISPQGEGTRSEIGIKVALGDSDGPETTQIIIFAARMSPNIRTIQLTVARLTTAPPAPTRLPRPDDPIPRKPSIMFGRRELKRAGSTSLGVPRELKRVASGSVAPAEGAKRQKLSGAGSLADLGSGVRLGSVGGEGMFKVPEVPLKAGVKGKKKGKERAEDVFGDVTEVMQESGGGRAKGKKKALEESHDASGKPGEEESEVEKANKNMIKKAAMNYLARTKDPTSLRLIDKTHPEFKEIWGYVYRGVGFALRAQMRTAPVNAGAVYRLVAVHVGMYVGGDGDTGVDSSGLITNGS